MDDSSHPHHHHHHADGPAHKKPRRNSSLTARFSTPRFHQHASMKQSQILTPPLTPPRSPRSSMQSTPAHKPAARNASRVHFDLHMSIHGSTSTIHSTMTESSLWTLPGCTDIDHVNDNNSSSSNNNNNNTDEQNPPTTPLPPSTPRAENRWTRLLQSAASSNRDRHRARLERDGWAFIGGRYSDELAELSSDESAASLDDEFDLVILPTESVGC